MLLKDKICQDLNIPMQLLDEALLLAHSKKALFKIKKKSGGYRLIAQPNAKTKLIQYWLIHNVFGKLPIHSAATGFRENISILDNARMHSKNRFFVRIDIENFFPSIKFNDIIPIIRKWHAASHPGWILDSNSLITIKNCCFDTQASLPIGYPSSPSISNAVMFSIDEQISNAINQSASNGNVIYTRYADDLIFSTDKENSCKKIFEQVREIIDTTISPRLKINYEKLKYGSSTGGSAAVTGLKILPGGKISIHKNQKDHIRLLLSLYKKGKLAKEDQKSLVGHLSYISHVDPAFYSKMQLNFLHEISRLKFELRNSHASNEEKLVPPKVHINNS